jgi:sugar transferase (PEP-CTERM system associated)
MVRLFHAYFPLRTVVLSVSEALIVPLAFATATVVWFGRDADLILAYEHGLTKISVATSVFLICMYYGGLYERLALNDQREMFNRLLQVLGVGTLILALLYYIYPQARLGRGVFAMGAVLLVAFVSFWRKAFFAAAKGMNLGRAVILGNDPLAHLLAQEIAKRPEVGLKVMGYVSSDGANGNGLRYLGEASSVAEVVQSTHADQVVVAMGDRRGRLPVEELLALKTAGVLVQDGDQLYESITGKLPIASLRLSWLLFSPGFRISRTMLIYKRVCSVFSSVVGLLLTLPLMLLAAIAVRLDSPGPVILRQQRVGKNGKPFTLYKFRSMHAGTDKSGYQRPARRGDERFTRVGRFLRRTRIDELPQLFNILRGDMYFIGPRPFVPTQEEELAQKIPFYRQRWAVKPGATGWAQINHGYCATLEDNAEKLAYDLFYIKNMSVGLDLLIFFSTVKTLLLGWGAV